MCRPIGALMDGPRTRGIGRDRGIASLQVSSQLKNATMALVWVLAGRTCRLVASPMQRCRLCGRPFDGPSVWIGSAAASRFHDRDARQPTLKPGCWTAAFRLLTVPAIRSRWPLPGISPGPSAHRRRPGGRHPKVGIGKSAPKGRRRTGRLRRRARLETVRGQHLWRHASMAIDRQP